MFETTLNSAFKRSDVTSGKTLSFKATEEELQAIKELMIIYGEVYTSNIIRMALKELYLKSFDNKK